MSPAPWENWFRSGDIGLPPIDLELPMDFMLTFRGFIPGNKGDLRDIHNIREALHLQLKNLPELDKRMEKYKAEPLMDYQVRPAAFRDANPCFKWDFGGYEYVPLVQRHQETYCQTDIVWVRPVSAGAPSGSDLDNCYRNLMDGLTLPKEAQMQGIDGPPDPAARRRYCLLEDDSLVTGFSVKAFRSLEDIRNVSGMNPREKPTAQVDLLIHVTLQSKWTYWGQSGVF